MILVVEWKSVPVFVCHYSDVVDYFQDKGNHLDYVVTLDIDAVETADFVNYKLEIVNDQGEIRQAVQLEEGASACYTA